MKTTILLSLLLGLGAPAPLSADTAARPFAPGLVVEWVDAGETALCPACGVDAVVGLDCRPDAEWIMQERCRRFG